MIKRATIARRERRASQRWASRLKFRCRLKRATEEGAWIASVRDISTNGIGLNVNRPVKAGMSLTLEIPTHAGQINKTVLVRVRHARPLSNQGDGRVGWWVVGGKLSRKLSHEEIEFLRNRAPAILLVQSERRTVVRHTTRLKAPCPVIRVAEEGPWFATLRNVSFSGLSMIANRPFKGSTLLTVELPNKTGGLTTRRLFRVLHVRQQPGSQWWIIGGQLLSPLAPQELRDLL